MKKTKLFLKLLLPTLTIGSVVGGTLLSCTNSFIDHSDPDITANWKSAIIRASIADTNKNLNITINYSYLAMVGKLISKTYGHQPVSTNLEAAHLALYTLSLADKVKGHTGWKPLIISPNYPNVGLFKDLTTQDLDNLQAGYLSLSLIKGDLTQKGLTDLLEMDESDFSFDTLRLTTASTTDWQLSVASVLNLISANLDSTKTIISLHFSKTINNSDLNKIIVTKDKVDQTDNIFINKDLTDDSIVKITLRNTPKTFNIIDNDWEIAFDKTTIPVTN